MKKISLLIATAALALVVFGSTVAIAQDDSDTTTTTRTVELPLPDNSSLQMGGAMVRGLHNPGELADLIHTSLLKDPTGNTKLTPTRCKKSDGDSCAKPIDYLNALIKWHAESGITDLSQLEGFIRGLNSNVIAEGDYLSARMVGDRLDITSGFHRHLAKGEHAWTDPKTGQPILMENCGNVMQPAPIEELPVTGDCQSITYNTPGWAKEILVFVFGPKSIPAHTPSCNWGEKQPGDTHFVDAVIDCERDVCIDNKRNWAIQNHRPVTGSIRFSYAVTNPGLNTYRLPSWINTDEYTIFVCPMGPGGRAIGSHVSEHVHGARLHDFPLKPFLEVPPGTPLPTRQAQASE